MASVAVPANLPWRQDGLESPWREQSDVLADWAIRLKRADPLGGFAEQDRVVPGRLRRIGLAELRFWGLECLAEPAAVLISELVTNAYRHGRSDYVEFRLRRTVTHPAGTGIFAGLYQKHSCARWNPTVSTSSISSL